MAEDWKTISILSADDGQLLNSFATAENRILNIGSHWTPDGKALAYIVHYKNTSNLYVQPVDGANPRPLTDFTGGEIYNFVFSSDGTRILLARGYAVRNALLIKNFR